MKFLKEIPQYPNNFYGCDLKDGSQFRNKKISLGVWHCFDCNYDVCPSHYKTLHLDWKADQIMERLRQNGFKQKFTYKCEKDHILEFVKEIPKYSSGRYICNTRTDEKDYGYKNRDVNTGVWHCSQCSFDICNDHYVEAKFAWAKQKLDQNMGLKSIIAEEEKEEETTVEEKEEQSEEEHQYIYGFTQEEYERMAWKRAVKNRNGKTWFTPHLNQ